MKKLVFLLALLLLGALLVSCGNDPPAPDEKDFTVTFVVDGVKTEVGVDAGEVPKYTGKFPRGKVFACWDKTILAATENATYTAVLTDEAVITAYGLKEAWNSTNTVKYDGYSQSYLSTCGGLFCLVVEEYYSAAGGPVRDRIVEVLEAMTTGGQGPMPELLPVWYTAQHSAAYALARMTPTVWEALDENVKECMDWTMRAYAVTTSFGTADWNNYRAGPGLYNDYSKGWNPNYELANVLPIVNATYYFGVGEDYEFDTSVGAAAVNAILNGFDFDTYISAFRRVGLTTLADRWECCDSMNTETGLKTPAVLDAVRTAMNEGGNQAYDLGSGKGVKVPKGYTGYTYTRGEVAYTLETPAAIACSLFAYNCSGGTVTSYGGMAGDGGYTLVNPEDNPMIGLQGMFIEFNEGNRSSAGYCCKDFVLCCAEITFLDAIGEFDREGADKGVYDLMYAGMNDFIYKYRMGYHSVVKASTYTSYTDEHESGWAGYYHMRSLWIVNFSDATTDFLTEGAY